MTKSRKILIVIAIGAMLIIGGVIGVVHLNMSSAEYKERQHLQIDGYRNVTADSVKKGKLTLFIETDLSLSKQNEMQLFEALKDDYDYLESKLKLAPVVNVAIISDDYILSESDGFAYNHGIVVCTLTAFENKNYRTAFTGGYLRTTEKWKQVAVKEYVFGEKNCENMTALKSYYENNEDELLLTLFQGYFNKKFASEKIIEIANMTAAHLGKYILDNYGLNDLMSASLTDYRSDWLKNNNINATFNTSCDLSWLNGAVYSEKFLQYPLVIETDNRAFYLDSFHHERDSATFDTPRTVIEHLSNGYTGVTEVLEYLRLNSATKNIAGDIANNYDRKIEYYISSHERGTEADVDSGKVYLRDPSEFIHETMHILTMDKNRVNGAWLAEGLAEFLCREKSKVKSDIDYRMYYSFKGTDATGELKAFVEEVKIKYKSLGGSFNSFEEFEFNLLEQSIAYVTLAKPEYKQTIEFPYATTSVKDMRYLSTNDVGNNLTYPESYLLVKYLINKYGLEKVLLCCFDFNLERAFGKTYEDIYSDFVIAVQT